jgi:hypothetical protein
MKRARTPYKILGWVSENKRILERNKSRGEIIL